MPLKTNASQNIQNSLEKIGFSTKEAQVYMALVEIGESAPGIIAKRTGLKRPTTYIILEQLKSKGIVGHVKKHEKKLFSPVDPSFLLESEKKKYEELSSTVDELKKLKKLYEKAPDISLYEGDEGIIQILEDSLSAEKEILCWSNTELASSTALHQYHPFFLRKKIEKKIHSKCLFTYGENGLRFKKRAVEELREVYLIPLESFPFENEINIYNDKISIISLKDKFGVIVQNQNIADTQRSIFKLGFEYAKIIEKNVLFKRDWEYLSSKE